MRRVVPKILVAALALLLLGGCGQKETLLSLAAGTIEGTWHPIGGVIGGIINRYVAGIRVNVESTGGGVENVRLLGTNQADIALCIAATALNGYQGTYPYNQSFDNLRTLVSSFQLGFLQVAVLEASPLESVEDIHGQRVAVGPAGHGSIPRQQEIYEEMGISFESFTPIYLPFRDALQALGDRRLDASRIRKNIKLPPPDDGGPVVRNFIGSENGFANINSGHKDDTDFRHSCSGLSEIMLKRLALTPKDGGTRKSWSEREDLQIETYKGRDDCFRDVYGRMFWDKPAPTITTRFISLSNGRFGHPEENRAISLREGAALQTFPRSYTFCSESMETTARLIGNAVPPELARRIGLALQDKTTEKGGER